MTRHLCTDEILILQNGIARIERILIHNTPLSISSHSDEKTYNIFLLNILDSFMRCEEFDVSNTIFRDKARLHKLCKDICTLIGFTPIIEDGMIRLK